MIDESGEQLAADLLEVYGVDIRDIFVPGSRLTPLWLMVLIRGLPESCRYVAEQRGGPQFRGWDMSRYAAVATVNAVRALNHTYVAAHSKSKPKAPEPFPVPDSTVRRRKSNTFALLAAKKMAQGVREVKK